MTGHIDPTKEVFTRFRDNNREGLIHMLNLVTAPPTPTGGARPARKPMRPMAATAGRFSCALVAR
jgi:hypothetical protein